MQNDMQEDFEDWTYTLREAGFDEWTYTLREAKLKSGLIRYAKPS